ncbi:hypothetical protein C2845_PM12G04260 [Panicum miliaceum]|uniref:Uncharacterized protein n=1 Tax=Panicum miliaceum TaxID=4540 RepID=A0A3L6QJ45_PANMI|nr:hypothetical protein C2845_PM12G04260 [Panicum miliaceum]
MERRSPWSGLARRPTGVASTMAGADNNSLWIYKKELENEGCPNAEKTLEKQFSPWFKKHPVSEDGVQVDASVVDDPRGQREAEWQQDESGDGEDETIWQYMSDNEDLPIGIPPEDDDDIDYKIALAKPIRVDISAVLWSIIICSALTTSSKISITNASGCFFQIAQIAMLPMPKRASRSITLHKGSNVEPSICSQRQQPDG